MTNDRNLVRRLRIVCLAALGVVLLPATAPAQSLAEAAARLREPRHGTGGDAAARAVTVAIAGHAAHRIGDAELAGADLVLAEVADPDLSGTHDTLRLAAAYRDLLSGDPTLPRRTTPTNG